MDSDTEEVQQQPAGDPHALHSPALPPAAWLPTPPHRPLEPGPAPDPNTGALMPRRRNTGTPGPAALSGHWRPLPPFPGPGMLNLPLPHLAAAPTPSQQEGRQAAQPGDSESAAAMWALLPAGLQAVLRSAATPQAAATERANRHGAGVEPVTSHQQAGAAPAGLLIGTTAVAPPMREGADGGAGGNSGSGSRNDGSSNGGNGSGSGSDGSSSSSGGGGSAGGSPSCGDSTCSGTGQPVPAGASRHPRQAPAALPALPLLLPPPPPRREQRSPQPAVDPELQHSRGGAPGLGGDATKDITASHAAEMVGPTVASAGQIAASCSAGGAVFRTLVGIPTAGGLSAPPGPVFGLFMFPQRHGSRYSRGGGGGGGADGGGDQEEEDLHPDGGPPDDAKQSGDGAGKTAAVAAAAAAKVRPADDAGPSAAGGGGLVAAAAAAATTDPGPTAAAVHAAEGQEDPQLALPPPPPQLPQAPLHAGPSAPHVVRSGAASVGAAGRASAGARGAGAGLESEGDSDDVGPAPSLLFPKTQIQSAFAQWQMELSRRSRLSHPGCGPSTRGSQATKRWDANRQPPPPLPPPAGAGESAEGGAELTHPGTQPAQSPRKRVSSLELPQRQRLCREVWAAEDHGQGAATQHSTAQFVKAQPRHREAAAPVAAAVTAAGGCGHGFAVGTSSGGTPGQSQELVPAGQIVATAGMVPAPPDQATARAPAGAHGPDANQQAAPRSPGSRKATGVEGRGVRRASDR